MSLPSAECPQCRRILAVQVPDDGPVAVFPNHDWPPSTGGGRCSYSRTEVPSRSSYVDRRGDRDAIDDAHGLDPDPGAHTAFSRALAAADTVDDATEERIAELAAETQGDMDRGEALRERMTALGLPIVDAARDVAGFERHCRGDG